MRLECLERRWVEAIVGVDEEVRHVSLMVVLQPLLEHAETASAFPAALATAFTTFTTTFTIFFATATPKSSTAESSTAESSTVAAAAAAAAATAAAATAAAAAATTAVSAAVFAAAAAAAASCVVCHGCHSVARRRFAIQPRSAHHHTAATAELGTVMLLLRVGKMMRRFGSQ